jgi:heptosyltransferase-2
MRDAGAPGAARCGQVRPGAAGAPGAAGGVDVPRRLVVLAPNWLGDAVMALPLLRDLRLAWVATEIVVAARASVEPLFSMVADINGTVVLEGGRGRTVVAGARTNRARLAAGGFDAALLLPNSFAAAWLVRGAGIRERWGYVRDLRGRLLTRAIPRLRRYGHQVEYYQALGGALGVAAGPPHAAIIVPDHARDAAASLLEQNGIGRHQPFVVLAPGAAYGRAKQWPPDRFAELTHLLARDRVATVLVGAKGDLHACLEVATLAPGVNLAGRTELPILAALLCQARAVVSNDSGAMHLAAAAGARVTAVFGPTNERRTSPLPASPEAPPPIVVVNDVWCRPCMLRECPIDHRCMTRISAARVHATLRSSLEGVEG